MGEHAKAPDGPDFTAGIPGDSLLDGVPLLGRVGERPVLLTRVNGECHAIHAVCTHYGAPLGEGMIVGRQVRCPWHHAAFDLCTGRNLRPPALAPVATYEVRESDGRVIVMEKHEVSVTPPPAATLARNPSSVVIIGAGAAGVAAAERLRDEGYEGPVTLIDDDPDAVCDRPNLSKDNLAGSAPIEWATLRSPEQLQARGIELRRARVDAVDASRRTVHLADGATLAWEALILATGASPVMLPIPTAPELPLLTLRSLADCRAIIAAAEGAANKRAVVIGASFIGLEVAASLVARGLSVDVVAPETRPLERVLGEAFGDWIRSLHESQGVTFHLGRKPAATRADGVLLDDGTLLPADLVVAGVGVRPNLALAESLALAMDRGVVVNEFLETSVPGIWAVGDIARWPDPHTGERIRVEHWVVAQRQGATAAQNVLGARQRFDAVPFFWSAHYDVTIDYVGHAESWDRIEIDGSLEARDAEVRYIKNGRTLAVATVGRSSASLASEVAMEKAAS